MAYTTIDNPALFFNTLLYTGNGSSSHGVTGVGFTQDWTWIKERGATGNHFLFDTVRGDNKYVNSNTSDQEYTESGGMAFNSDGFTLGNWGSVNNNSDTFASWNWKAGGSASSNSDGSITSSVSANTTAGFSIVSYTGTGSNATVGHGLGAVPKMIFFKDRETSVDWGVYAEPNGNTKEMYLSTDDAAGTNTGAFNSTTPTSSVFTIGTSSRYNPSSKGVIAYCFAEKKGYSKIGKYVGNNNEDGAFVYLGFKPAFVMVKITDTQTDNWAMYDNKRNPFNLDTSQRLRANTNAAEATAGGDLDFFSNGFKVHGADGEINGSGASYLYLAFAEAPFVTAGTKAAGTAR